MKRYITEAFIAGRMNNFGIASVSIGDGMEYALDYNKDDQVTWAIVRTAKTVDLLETKMFFDNLTKKEYLNQKGYDSEANLSVYNTPDAE
jgi:hypothetical protein